MLLAIQCTFRFSVQNKLHVHGLYWLRLQIIDHSRIVSRGQGGYCLPKCDGQACSSKSVIPRLCISVLRFLDIEISHDFP